MALQNWDSTFGSPSRSYWCRVYGVKYKPFKPGPTIKPQPYARKSIRMIDAVMGSYGSPCNTTFWGEIVPVPLMYPNRDASSPELTSPEGNLAYAQAYAKFKDKVYTQAASLTAFRERVKTIDMILNRLIQLHKGAKALKRGRFGDFLDIFGIRPKAKHSKMKWTRPKQFGSLWLEYWMGWAPTIGDIYNAVDAYQKPIPNQTIRSGSTRTYKDSKKTTDGWQSKAVAYSSYEARGTIWIQGSVEVTNPSLHKAQALGLVNPVLTVWETTPFSWFFGWFNTLAQTLGQFTDWVGLKLKDLVISSKTKATSSWVCLNAQGVFGASYPRTMSFKKEFFWFGRNVLSGTLPTIKPTFRCPNGLSLTRGATLASLLVTIFAPGRK